MLQPTLEEHHRVGSRNHRLINVSPCCIGTESRKQEILRMISIIRRIIFLFFQQQTCWQCKGGVATLMEGSDATFSVKLLLLTENEATRDARCSRQESIEVRTLVPKGGFNSPTNYNWFFLFQIKSDWLILHGFNIGSLRLLILLQPWNTFL